MDPDLKNETRRPVLVRIAKTRGIAVPANLTVNEIKELLMTKSAAPAKPAPKPAAPAKPGAPKPAAPAAPSAGVSAKEFTEFQALVASAFETFGRRITQLELSLTGFGPYASVAEDGAVVLDIDNADRASLRFWAHKFGVGDPAADTESIRKALKKARAAKDFAGWTVVNDTEPDAEEGGEEEAAPAEEEEEAAEGDEEEEESITLAQIEAMNLTDLVALAKKAGIEYKDVAKQPKALRARIIEALSASEEEGEEEAEALTEGQSVNLAHEDGNTYPATFHGYDADGDALLSFEEGGEQSAFPASSVTPA